jgi:FAD:protein FMN transferase
MVRTERVMGTVVGLDLRDDGVDPDAVDSVFAWFHEVDARFSTYKEESEVNCISNGTLALADASLDMAEVLKICELVKRASGGSFDAWRAKDGQRFLDPSAVVKGWSVDRAAQMLVDANANNFCINAGGDVSANGCPEPGRAWRVGIRHPQDAEKVVAVVSVTDSAVATSGAYERGNHIVDPRTKEAPGEVSSMTVVGSRLALADAYSTAAFVMGADGVDWVANLPGYEAYAVTADGHTLRTPGFAVPAAVS